MDRFNKAARSLVQLTKDFLPDDEYDKQIPQRNPDRDVLYSEQTLRTTNTNNRVAVPDIMEQKAKATNIDKVYANVDDILGTNVDAELTFMRPDANQQVSLRNLKPSSIKLTAKEPMSSNDYFLMNDQSHNYLTSRNGAVQEFDEPFLGEQFGKKEKTTTSIVFKDDMGSIVPVEIKLPKSKTEQFNAGTDLRLQIKGNTGFDDAFLAYSENREHIGSLVFETRDERNYYGERMEDGGVIPVINDMTKTFEIDSFLADARVDTDSYPSERFNTTYDRRSTRGDGSHGPTRFSQKGEAFLSIDEDVDAFLSLDQSKREPYSYAYAAGQYSYSDSNARDNSTYGVQERFYNISSDRGEYRGPARFSVSGEAFGGY